MEWSESESFEKKLYKNGLYGTKRQRSDLPNQSVTSRSQEFGNLYPKNSLEVPKISREFGTCTREFAISLVGTGKKIVP